METTDRQLVADKNYTELYNRYSAKIFKESLKVHVSSREDFVQEAFFTVCTAVDKADMSRNWTSFNTILYYHMLGLVNKFRSEAHKEDGSFSFEESSGEQETSPGSNYMELVARNHPSLTMYHPEKVLENDEKALEARYNKFMNSLPEIHKKYMKLKEEGYTRKEIAEGIGKRVGQLSFISHEIKTVACEVFGIDYNNHRNPERARRVMARANN